MSDSPTNTGADLIAHQQDGVLRLTIQRESRRNAISPAVINALAAALRLR